jgi:uncharacterized protein (DUF924 family)
MFRGTPHAYATDALALRVAVQAIENGLDQKFRTLWKRFFYFPFMHSERLADQKRGLELCCAAEDEGGIEASRIHLAIIEKFGRFPHRNAILGRETTAEEQAYLDADGYIA